MKTYKMTVHLYVDVTAESQEEAKVKAKTLVDESLYYYSNTVGKDKSVGAISKSKVTWSKGNKEEHEV